MRRRTGLMPAEPPLGAAGLAVEDREQAPILAFCARGTAGELVLQG
jgi:hypothetical protein